METPKWPTADEIIANSLRDEVRELLAQCTEKQQEFFGRVFPGDIENLTEAQLRNAVGICQRTITQNRKAAEPA